MNAADIRAAAELFWSRIQGDREAVLEEPIPVESPSGELDSWFVALIARGNIVGFLQLEPDLGFRRHSTFGAPVPAAAWLDREGIRARAQEAAGAEDVGDPVLTYTGSRDRLAWRVRVANGDTVYVAGEHTFVD